MKNTDPLTFTWSDFAHALFYLFGDKKYKYVVSLIVVIVLNAYVVVPPLIIGRMIDFFVGYSQGDSLTTFYFYIIFLGVFLAMAQYLILTVTQVFFRLSNELKAEIRVRGFEKLLEQSLAEHGEENTGAKYQVIQNGIGALNGFTEALNNRILPTIAAIVGVFGVFAYLSLWYNIIFTLYIIGFVLILAYFRKQFVTLSHEKNIALEKSSATYIESLSNIMTIKSSGAEKKFKSSVAQKEGLGKDFDQKMLNVRVNQWKVFHVFNALFTGLFLFAAGVDVITGVITVGSIAILLAYMENITRAATNVLGVYGTLIEQRTTIARMMGVFWGRDSLPDGSELFPRTWRKLSLKNAHYAYKTKRGAKTNISGVNLDIYKNQKVGIVGTTGSGKSTLVKLLLGLYPLDKGEYVIGSTSFYDIQREEIMRHMAIVLQESEMFNLSLSENIALGESMNQEKLDRAIEIAQLEPVVTSLPQGVDTLIGEKGYHLSGGERQRVGIARAIYKDPDIIILDEATSSLDMRTEKKIQQALLKNLKKKTLVIIAHRTSTLKDVDIIYKVENGRIVDHGSYTDFF